MDGHPSGEVMASGGPTGHGRRDVERIPLFDATAPVACTIGEGEIEDRLALLDRLRSALVTLDRSEHGLLLHFPTDPEVIADVQRFAVDEKRCCTFWGFAVDVAAGGATLRWDAPPDAAPLLARIEAFLVGDEPLGDLRSLL